MRDRVPTVEEFLASLQQVVIIQRLNQGSLARAAQMCQRTNQFNLTSHRYTVGDLEPLMCDPAAQAYTVTVKDRFGDSGITGLSILRFDGEDAEVDTLLLSCRVLGRQIEDALLVFLSCCARENGAHYLIGRYNPTAKNSQVKDFYPDGGFRTEGSGGFRLDLRQQGRVTPPYIEVRVVADA